MNQTNTPTLHELLIAARSLRDKITELERQEQYALDQIANLSPVKVGSVAQENYGTCRRFIVERVKAKPCFGRYAWAYDGSVLRANGQPHATHRGSASRFIEE